MRVQEGGDVGRAPLYECEVPILPPEVRDAHYEYTMKHKVPMKSRVQREDYLPAHIVDPVGFIILPERSKFVARKAPCCQCLLHRGLGSFTPRNLKAKRSGKGGIIDHIVGHRESPDLICISICFVQTLLLPSILDTVTRRSTRNWQTLGRNLQSRN